MINIKKNYYLEKLINSKNLKIDSHSNQVNQYFFDLVDYKFKGTKEDKRRIKEFITKSPVGFRLDRLFSKTRFKNFNNYIKEVNFLHGIPLEFSLYYWKAIRFKEFESIFYYWANELYKKLNDDYEKK